MELDEAAFVDGANRWTVLTRIITPLAAPLFLEHGRVPVAGSADERLLAEEEAALMEAAGLT